MKEHLPRFAIQSALLLVAAACSSDDDPQGGGQQNVGALDAGHNDAATGGADAASPALDAATDGGTRDAALGTDTGTPPADAASSDASGSSDSTAGDALAGELPKFSFFVTSLSAMRMLSGSPNGFGGDFSHGETGAGAGLRGADKICAEVAELGMAGASAKQWRAFLSTTTVHARTRIGSGPWYDRMGRLIAHNLTDLLKERPVGAETEIRDDLPNERGEPNRAGSAENGLDDNHDMVTGTDAQGDYDGGNTCADWTSTTATGGGPRVGHAWPAGSGRSWMTAHTAPGCAASVNLRQGPGGGSGGAGIGAAGGYGGIYCFALTP
jgi:hypothetical protein